jgi:hypothetical protein
VFGSRERLGSTITLDGTNIQTSTIGSGMAGTIFLQAYNIALNGGTLESDTTGQFTGAIYVGSGIAGCFCFRENRVGSRITMDGTHIRAGSTGDGGGGLIYLQASNTVFTGGILELINVGDGTGGSVFVGSAPRDSPVGFLHESGSSITLEGTTIKTSHAASRSNFGLVASVSIEAEAVALNGVTIESSSAGVEDASEIFIGGGPGFHTDLGSSSIAMNESNIRSSASGTGDGGRIFLNAANIALSRSIIESSTSGDGDAGNIAVGTGFFSGTPADANSTITLIDTRVSTSTAASGDAGRILFSSENLHLLDSTIASESLGGTGNGGLIFLQTENFGALRMDNSQIATRAVSAGGGDIEILTDGGPITLRDSTIEASAGADGKGGDITVRGAGQTILQASGILARAEDGDGGRIAINLAPGEVFLQDSASLVSADSGSGINGEVTINSPNTDMNAAMQPQDVDVSTPATLGLNACAPTTADNRSTFVRAGRGAVGEKPDGYLTSMPISASEEAEHEDVEIAMSGFVSTSKRTVSIDTSSLASLGIGCR